jgi:hypothetical protein
MSETTTDPGREFDALLTDAFARLHGTNHCVYLQMVDLVDAFRSSLHRINRLIKSNPMVVTDERMAKLTSIREVAQSIEVPPTRWNSAFFGVPKREVDDIPGEI